MSRGAPMPNSSQNGSARWRTSRLDEMLTTAGAARFTTGANEDFMVRASPGAARTGWASGGIWALDLAVGSEQAASRAMAGIRTR